MLLNHMAHTTDGQKALDQPIVVANEDKTKFLVCSGFEILQDMGKLPVLNVSKTRRGHEQQSVSTGP